MAKIRNAAAPWEIKQMRRWAHRLQYETMHSSYNAPFSRSFIRSIDRIGRALDRFMKACDTEQGRKDRAK